MSLVDRIAEWRRWSQNEGAFFALALAASALWLVIVGLGWLLAPEPAQPVGGLRRLLSWLGVLTPLALIWVAAYLSTSLAGLRAEADELRARIEAMRNTVDGAGAQRQAPVGLRTETAPARRPVASQRPQISDTRQTSMELDDPAPVDVPPGVLVRALNFPDGPEDTETIAALHTALKDHDSARLLRSAQDVITLLAGHDIYMDDFAPAPAHVHAWRRFGEGIRGADVSDVGAILDETALQAVSDLLHRDEIFRDVAHHFMRQFDAMLARYLERLDDEQIRWLGDTRSARAFMLISRAAGLFD